MTIAAEPLAAFADAVVHELRTPLSVISGEIDLALARDRSPAAYREALTRIAESVAELVDLTDDLALCGGSAADRAAETAHAAALSTVIAELQERFGARRGAPVRFAVQSLPSRAAVCGPFIGGALALLVEHAVKHRRSGSHVVLETRPNAEAPRGSAATLDVRLVATPGGFSPSAWVMLAGPQEPAGSSPGRMRVETAAGIIRGSGGTLELTTVDGTDSVLIRLRLTPDEAE